MTKKINYHDYLIDSLKNTEEAIGYLNAALDGGDVKVFLLALQNVIKAQGGISNLADKTHKSRTSLYKALSLKGNPHLESTNNILGAIGLHLQVAHKRSPKPKNKKNTTSKAA